MPTPLAIISPEQTRNRAGNVTPALTSPVPLAAAPYGTAWTVYEAGTNHCINPSAEVDASGWTAESWASFIRQSGGGGAGTWRFIATADATLGGRVYTDAAFAPGEYLSWQARIYSSVSGRIVNMRVEWLDATDTVLGTVNGANISLSTTTTVRMQENVGPAPAGTVKARCSIVRATTGWVSGNSLQWDAVSIEKRRSCTLYFDGSTGTGYAWSGTAHLSASTRTAAQVKIPTANNLNSVRGAVVIRARLLSLYGVSNRYIFGSGTHGTNDFLSIKIDSAHKPQAWVRSGSGTEQWITPNATAVLTANEHFDIYMGWDEQSLYFRGASDDVTITVPRNTAPVGASSTNMAFGSDANGGQHSNIEVDAVITYDEPLPEDEIDRLLNMVGPWTWDTAVTPVPPVYPKGVEVLSAGTNNVHNPSFRLNTTSWSLLTNSRGTLTRDTVEGWDGPHSLRFDCTSYAASGFAEFYQSSTTYRAPCIAGIPVDIACRFKTNNPSIGIMISTTFYNGLGTALTTPTTTIYYDLNNGAWNTVVASYIPPANAVTYITRYRFYTRDAAAVGGIAWIDGLHTAPSSTGVVGYVDGDMGLAYGWTGTANLSPSFRIVQFAAKPMGYGGVLTVGSRVFLSDRNATLGTEISEDVTGGSIEYNIDRDGPKGTIRLRVLNADRLDEFDWVMVYTFVEHENGAFEYEPAGLFRLEHPRDLFDSESVETEYGGYDITTMLADRTLTDTVTLAGGQNVVNHIRARLDVIGVRHAIPDSTAVAPTAGISSKPGTSELKHLNDCAAAIGVYGLYANRQGIVVTKASPGSLYDVEPSAYYTIGQDTDLVGDLVFDPVDDTIFNQIVVIRDDPANGGVLTAVRNFTNPASKVSQPNLGVRSKVFTVQDAANQAAIDAIADRLIEERTMYVNGSILVIHRPGFELHETIELDLSGLADVPGAEEYSGRWYVKAHTIPLDNTDGIMRLEIRRIERFDQ